MDLKTQNTFQRYLDAITNNTFDEILIKAFLIDIRDYLPKGNLREICDSIAHPLREKGGSWGKLNYYYWQLKYAPIKGTPRPVTPYPADRHSKQEQAALLQGVKNTSDERIKAAFGCNTATHAKRIGNCYTKKDGEYVLKKGHRHREVLSETLNVCIRHIEPKALMSQDDLVVEVEQALQLLVDTHECLSFEMASLKACGDEMALCIVGFLQSIKFHLYDGTVATSRISPISNEEGKHDLYLCGLIPVPHMNEKFSLPLISTKVVAERFIGDAKHGEGLGAFNVIRDEDLKIALELLEDHGK